MIHDLTKPHVGRDAILLAKQTIHKKCRYQHEHQAACTQKLCPKLPQLDHLPSLGAVHGPVQMQRRKPGGNDVRTTCARGIT